MHLRNITIPYETGFSVSTARTVSESDVYLFAGVSGDMNQVHLNEQYMRTTDLGHRVAHGMLTFSIASAAETELVNARARELEEAGVTYLSVGYEHVRFLRPVFFGDTLTTTYELVEIDRTRGRSQGKLTVRNQNDETVLVGTHIMAFFPKIK